MKGRGKGKRQEKGRDDDADDNDAGYVRDAPRTSEKRSWEDSTPWHEAKRKEPLRAWEKKTQPVGDDKRDSGKGGRRPDDNTGGAKRSRADEVVRRPRPTPKSSLGPPAALPPRPPPFPGPSSRASTPRSGGKGPTPAALPSSDIRRPGGKPSRYDDSRRNEEFRDRGNRDYGSRTNDRERSPPLGRNKGSGKGYGKGSSGKVRESFSRDRSKGPHPRNGGKGGGGGGNPSRGSVPTSRDRDRQSHSKGGSSRGYDRERRR